MINPGQVMVTLTPELRQLALEHVRETEEGPDAEDLTRWFQEQETPDGYVLDAATDQGEAHMIVVIARALLWEHERCVQCRHMYDPRAIYGGHTATCDYRDA